MSHCVFIIPTVSHCVCIIPIDIFLSQYVTFRLRTYHSHCIYISSHSLVICIVEVIKTLGIILMIICVLFPLYPYLSNCVFIIPTVFISFPLCLYFSYCAICIFPIMYVSSSYCLHQSHYIKYSRYVYHVLIRFTQTKINLCNHNNRLV
jgi:hypothetical protein